MNIKDQLTKMEHFSNSEKDLAKYILKNKERVLSMSVQELSKETYTSVSTVVRLCKKMNLKGFAEFKIKFAAELQKNQDNKSENHLINVNFPLDEDDSFYEITKKLYELMSDTLQDIYQKVSINEFEKAVQLIQKSNRTAIFSGGDNYMPALSFQNRMMKINKQILMVTVPYENEQLAFNMNSNDCAIVITYSGASSFLDKIINTLKRNSVPIITITARPNSRIGKISTIILQNTDKESQSIKFSTFASQLGTEFILNTLYSYFFVMNYEKNSKNRIDAEINFLDGRK